MSVPRPQASRAAGQPLPSDRCTARFAFYFGSISGGCKGEGCALSWTRYRSFKDRQRVEVAPITLIIGRNGSGKSVISRLPLLLASGVDAGALDPLDLSAGGVVHAATYQDRVHSRGRLPFSLGAEVSSEGDRFEFETSLRYISEFRSLAVEAFWISRRGGRILQAELSDRVSSLRPILGTTCVSEVRLRPKISILLAFFQINQPSKVC